MDISQIEILKKFSAYMKLNAKKLESDITKSTGNKERIAALKKIHASVLKLEAKLAEGLCHGFSICQASMELVGGEKKWFNSLRAIRAWDEKESSLKNEVKLKENQLEEENLLFSFFKKISNNKTTVKIEKIILSDLFERIISNVVFNFASSVLTPELSSISQENFLKKGGMFELFNTDTKKAQKIKGYKCLVGHFSNNQLEKILSKKLISNNIVLIDSPNHSCSLTFKEDNYLFYDPNYQTGRPKNFKSSQSSKMVKLIEKSLGNDLNIRIASFDKLGSELSSPEFMKMDFLDLIQGESLFSIVNYTPKALERIKEIKIIKTQESAQIDKIINVFKVVKSTLAHKNNTSLLQLAKFYPKALEHFAEIILSTSKENQEKITEVLLDVLFVKNTAGELAHNYILKQKNNPPLKILTITPSLLLKSLEKKINKDENGISLLNKKFPHILSSVLPFDYFMTAPAKYKTEIKKIIELGGSQFLPMLVKILDALPELIKKYSTTPKVLMQLLSVKIDNDKTVIESLSHKQLENFIPKICIMDRGARILLNLQNKKTGWYSTFAIILEQSPGLIDDILNAINKDERALGLFNKLLQKNNDQETTLLDIIAQYSPQTLPKIIKSNNKNDQLIINAFVNTVSKIDEGSKYQGLHIFITDFPKLTSRLLHKLTAEVNEITVGSIKDSLDIKNNQLKSVVNIINEKGSDKAKKQLAALVKVIKKYNNNSHNITNVIKDELNEIKKEDVNQVNENISNYRK